MSLQQCLALAAMASLPLAAAAQQTEYNPANPDAPGGRLRYESAFNNYRAPNDESQSPDKIWRSINDDMEKLGGHAGHMKANAGQLEASPADHASHHRERVE